MAVYSKHGIGITIWQDVQIMTILITIPNRQLFPKKYRRKIKFNNDMSVEWTLPKDFDGEVVTKFLAYTSDKQCKSIYEDGVTDKLSTEDIIKLFATSYPNIDYIRCIY